VLSFVVKFRSLWTPNVDDSVLVVLDDDEYFEGNGKFAHVPFVHNM